MKHQEDFSSCSKRLRSYIWAWSLIESEDSFQSLYNVFRCKDLVQRKEPDRDSPKTSIASFRMGILILSVKEKEPICVLVRCKDKKLGEKSLFKRVIQQPDLVGVPKLFQTGHDERYFQFLLFRVAYACRGRYGN
jgi:hypothetical protein